MPNAPCAWRDRNAVSVG